MPVHFTWDNPEKRVAHYKFEGKWTWDELYESFRASWNEFIQLDHVIDSISDLTQTKTLPPSAMTHVRSLSQNRPPNTGVMIIVGANTFMTVAMQTFRQIFAATLKRDLDVLFAKTLDEAHAIIAEKQAERSL
ncbi:MAG: hypothetical protein ABI690_01940 [Chloroflexota bacterium]